MAYRQPNSITGLTSPLAQKKTLREKVEILEGYDGITTKEGGTTHRQNPDNPGKFTELSESDINKYYKEYIQKKSYR